MQDMLDFFRDLRHEGFWVAMTGKKFFTWLIDGAEWALGYSDILMVVGLILTLLSLAGSERAKKGLYWTVIAYLLLKVLQFALGGGLL